MYNTFPLQFLSFSFLCYPDIKCFICLICLIIWQYLLQKVTSKHYDDVYVLKELYVSKKCKEDSVQYELSTKWTNKNVFECTFQYWILFSTLPADSAGHHTLWTGTGTQWTPPTHSWSYGLSCWCKTRIQEQMLKKTDNTKMYAMFQTSVTKQCCTADSTLPMEAAYVTQCLVQWTHGHIWAQSSFQDVPF